MEPLCNGIFLQIPEVNDCRMCHPLLTKSLVLTGDVLVYRWDREQTQNTKLDVQPNRSTKKLRRGRQAENLFRQSGSLVCSLFPWTFIEGTGDWSEIVGRFLYSSVQVTTVLSERRPDSLECVNDTVRVKYFFGVTEFSGCWKGTQTIKIKIRDRSHAEVVHKLLLGHQGIILLIKLTTKLCGIVTWFFEGWVVGRVNQFVFN